MHKLDHKESYKGKVPEFQSLLRRYTLQLRYGCTSTKCTSPHCFSNKKRTARRPIRRPNAYTARMQAQILATRPRPYEALCPHPLEVNAQEYRLDDAEQEIICYVDNNEAADKSSVDGELRSTYEPKGEIRVKNVEGQSTTVALIVPAADVSPSAIVTSSWSAFHLSLDPKKDPKSITQRLFDTFALKRFEKTPGHLAPASPTHLSLLFSTHLILHRWPSDDPRLLVVELLKKLTAYLFNGQLQQFWQLEGGERLLFACLNIVLEQDVNYEPAFHAIECLARAIAAHRCGFESMHDLDSRSHTSLALKLILHGIKDIGLMMDWMQYLITQRWDGEPVIQRWSAVGSAMEVLCGIQKLEDFYPDSPFKFTKTLDQHTLVSSFLKHTPNPNTRHILSYPLFFDIHEFVACFREINYIKMFGAHRSAGYVRDTSRSFRSTLNAGVELYIRDRLSVSETKFLILDVRREYILEDTFHQLRGKEKRELIKPLKVKMGLDEGEEGIDYGGVTQEFFRVAFRKIFDDNFGMFVTNTSTHMSWLRPLSPVELDFWEFVGLLMSLAVYNGAVVPVNLPSVFYHRLLGYPEPTRIEEIQDGWPDIANSLEQLQRCDRQEMKDVALQYTFTIQTPFRPLHPLPERKLQKTRSSAADAWTVVYNLVDEGALLPHVLERYGEKARDWIESAQRSAWVTPENVRPYIKDYIHFLTVTSVDPQFKSLSKGFNACLDPAVLSILNPPILQRLVEGSHELDIDALEEEAKFGDDVARYSEEHVIIMWFWGIVRDWPPEMQRRLLEFVTGTDRVPVGGAPEITIQRSGDDSDSLPGSSTCYSILMLPEYSTKEKLQAKLETALRMADGFGVG